MNAAKLALLTVCRNEIAPRFDMAAEVLIAPMAPGDAPPDPDGNDCKRLVLAHISSEELCDLITRSGVATVVCGAIEEDYYHYLRWKRIDVICDVMGHESAVLEKLVSGVLKDGDRLYT